MERRDLGEAGDAQGDIYVDAWITVPFRMFISIIFEESNLQ